MEWVRTNKKMPLDGERVLTFNDVTGIQFLFHSNKGWKYCYNGNLFEFTVTHWMKLPEIPR